MKVNVAGAGAGKTTKMADLVTEHEIQEGKVVFCIAFTNAAAENIVEKVERKLGVVPDNIRISTIHSFLYQELINPYYYFLYGKHFNKLSVIDLPSNNAYKRTKLSELEANDILHYTKIPEKAKWVTYQKSGDTKAIKELRKKILSRFAAYCDCIYVDEAQDIGEDVKLILEALDHEGIKIILYGDPKQDVRGLGYYRKIIDATLDVKYISDCYRCPQKHLDLSNTLASEPEQQTADSDNAEGRIEIVFESDIEDMQAFLNEGAFGLAYISMKRDRFLTHENQGTGKRFETLQHEVYRAMADKWTGIKSDIEIKRAAFYVTEQMMEEFGNGSAVAGIISKWITGGAFDSLSKQRYAQMAAVFQQEDHNSTNVPVVRSIEIIKGLEAERCLFILSPDLAPYLFREKTEDNKTSHLLYVALTRSLDNLTIMIMKEVEENYTREKVLSYFRSVLQQ